MLVHPTLEQLKQMRLKGMAEALEEQLDSAEMQALDFEQRLALLVEREVTQRRSRQMATRLRQAGFQQQASFEDLDLKKARGLDAALMHSLSDGQWVRQALNCLITGPTGVGKSYIATAMAHKACREGFSARYYRLSRLIQALRAARGDGSYPKLLKQLARFDILIIDDWGLAQPDDETRRDLLEILDDRFNKRSTIVTGQLPVAKWHDYLGDPTLADAILDRLVHNAYKIELKGDSMRKRKNPLTEDNNKD